MPKITAFFDSLSARIDATTDRIAQLSSWAILGMVAVTFLIVVLRYLFNVGWVWLQEVVLYLHAFVLLIGAGPTLLKEGHVRVDVFYQRFSKKTQTIINLAGACFCLFPLTLWVFCESLPYILDSWSVLEGSKDGGGLEAVFILKSFIFLFCLFLFLQGVSSAWKNIKQLRLGEGVSGGATQ